MTVHPVQVALLPLRNPVLSRFDTIHQRRKNPKWWKFK